MIRPQLGYNDLTTNAQLKAQYKAACSEARRLRRDNHQTIEHNLWFYYGDAMCDVVMASLAPRQYAMLYEPLPVTTMKRGVRVWWAAGFGWVTIPNDKE